LLDKEGVFDDLERAAKALAKGLSDLAAEAEIPFSAEGVGGILGFRFHPGPVQNYTDVSKGDEGRFATFFHAMLDQGVYFAPSAYEVAFLTLAHGATEIEETLEAARKAFKKAS
jgi:glutamate-1-semialdehyde 2,1-aminomutase